MGCTREPAQCALEARHALCRWRLTAELRIDATCGDEVSSEMPHWSGPRLPQWGIQRTHLNPCVGVRYVMGSMLVMGSTTCRRLDSSCFLQAKAASRKASRRQTLGFVPEPQAPARPPRQRLNSRFFWLKVWCPREHIWGAGGVGDANVPGRDDSGLS